jgi:hypothetical protein
MQAKIFVLVRRFPRLGGFHPAAEFGATQKHSTKAWYSDHYVMGEAA